MEIKIANLEREISGISHYITEGQTKGHIIHSRTAYYEEDKNNTNLLSTS